MSGLFISHSSQDNPIARELDAWLKQKGFEAVFLDFDPEHGIAGGRVWEQELLLRLRRCQAVIALCGEHFSASEWCLYELAIASGLGKELFPLRIGAGPMPKLLAKLQWIDFSADRQEGYERLWRALLVKGFEPGNLFQWRAERPPYPGLMAFEREDTAMFFGREETIKEGREHLNRLRRGGGKALLLVLGASGSGKSSLVRASCRDWRRIGLRGWCSIRSDPALNRSRSSTSPWSPLSSGSTR